MTRLVNALRVVVYATLALAVAAGVMSGNAGEAHAIMESQCAQLSAELKVEHNRLVALKAATDRRNPGAVAAVNAQINAYNTRLQYAKQSCRGAITSPRQSTPPKNRNPQRDFAQPAPPARPQPGPYQVPPQFGSNFQSQNFRWTNGSSPYNRTPAQNAWTHWQDHRAEFPGWTASQYAARANRWASNPPASWWTVRSQGRLVTFDPVSGIFLAARNGAPATMFKPIEGAQYFLRSNGLGAKKLLDDLSGVAGIPAPKIP
ncbi:hypothetical protein [Gordonia soli]|uniref:Resuscitation-promoting factor core lysozyme-like domain-containing protein n=1 Tax=Gordonia soli NBRC 108243 TaxID=1223545 RepID=M0QKP5_9ACTN|nr:hypothetical protein [Gordonia soli]GAC69210.1 hypothetical protein GS4_23_00040 [Gordonia soli NBRC 108243]